MNLFIFQRTAVTEQGNVIPNAEITVYAAGTLTEVDLFDDSAGTPKSNPFNAGPTDGEAPGFLQFYSAFGQYDIAVNGTVLWENQTIGRPELSNITALSSLNTAVLTDGQQFSVKDGDKIRLFAWNESADDFDELPVVTDTDNVTGAGTAITRDTGTGNLQIPLNNDLGSASKVNTGTAAGDVPLNSDLGTASTKNTGTANDQIPLNANIVKPLSDITALSSLNTAALVDGQAFRITTTLRAGDFVWRAGDQKSNADADPQQGVWVTPDGEDGTNGAFERIYEGDIRAAWFGAFLDGAGDDRPAIQACLDYLDTSGGGTVRLSKGQWTIKTKRGAGGKEAIRLRDNIRFIGSGMGATVIKAHDDLPSDTPILWASGNFDIELAHFTINGNKQRLVTAGQAEDEGVDWYGGGRLWIHHLHIFDMGTDGIDLDLLAGAGDTATISQCVIRECGGTGLHSSWTNTNTSQVIAVNNGNDRFAASDPDVAADAANLDIKGGESSIANCLVIDGARGINLATANAPRVSDSTISGEFLGAAVVIGSGTAGGGPLNGRLTGCTISASSPVAAVWVKKENGFLIESCSVTGIVGLQATPGIVIDPASTGVTIKGGSVQGTARGDIVVESGATGWKVQNVTSKQSSALAGIRIEAASDGIIKGLIGTTSGRNIDLRGACDNVQISQSFLPASDSIRFLVDGGGLKPSNCKILNNELVNISTTSGDFTNQGHTIRGNDGYYEEASGTADFVSGTDSVVVTHNLPQTNVPTAYGDFVSVQISLGAGTDPANEKFWVSAIDESTFTITRASGLTQRVDWEAVRRFNS